ncbi:viral RNA polymerase beta-prime subunit [Staphylococcus phage vB_StaM_PB50]|nr:viral RNA polymerase beta-prime subunit [Staphylococcus phage vB_StaM_PB50]
MVNMTYDKKDLSEKEISTLLSIKKEDITLDKLKELFAFRQNTQPMFNPSDRFKLKKDLVYNSKDERTTVGRYIFNKFILDNKIGPIIGYMNKDMGGSGVGNLQSELSSLLLNDVITTKDMNMYIDKLQWLGFSIAGFINSSLTTTMMVAPDKVKQKKEELLEKYGKALNTPGEELNAISAIEEELIKLSKEELEGLADLDIYDSKSRGSFENNFKLTALIRGANKNFADPSKIRIAKSSLADGIDPEELYMFGDIMTAGSAGRALGTQEGG